MTFPVGNSGTVRTAPSPASYIYYPKYYCSACEKSSYHEVYIRYCYRCNKYYCSKCRKNYRKVNNEKKFMLGFNIDNTNIPGGKRFICDTCKAELPVCSVCLYHSNKICKPNKHKTYLDLLPKDIINEIAKYTGFLIKDTFGFSIIT